MVNSSRSDVWFRGAASFLAPVTVGPVLVVTTAGLWAFVMGLDFGLADGSLSAGDIFKLPVLVVAAIFMGLLVSIPALLVVYPISVVLINAIAWPLGYVSSRDQAWKRRRCWLMAGALVGAAAAVVVNLYIQSHAAGLLFFRREGESATLWRVVASIGCMVAGAVATLAWRAIAWAKTPGQP